MTLLGFASPPASAQSGSLTLLYACDRQSEPCKVWEKQWEPIFAASPAARKVTLRKVNAPDAKALLKPASWPADLRWVLDIFLMSQEGVQDGYDTPRFFLLQDGQIAFASVGNSGWREFMWPTILDMTNTSP
ncbi:MAG: hypothetical protein ACOY4R_05135 [Pseudomonadota bacterium]